MPNTLKDQQSNIIVGLGTYTYVVPAGVSANSLYTVGVRAAENPPSGLSIVINLNGSPKDSRSVLSDTQQVLNARAQFQCMAGDTISVVISSSAPNDLLLNTVKTLVNLRAGL